MGTNKRPVFLDLTKMRFPVTAIVSIMHRISGVLLFLLLPFALYLLHHSLSSEDNFEALQSILSQPVVALSVWVLVCALAFHVFAGIRHIVMDCGFGEHLSAARFSAYLIFCAEVVTMIMVGVWLW